MYANDTLGRDAMVAASNKTTLLLCSTFIYLVMGSPFDCRMSILSWLKTKAQHRLALVRSIVK
jgi:hypothetical protein